MASKMRAVGPTVDLKASGRPKSIFLSNFGFMAQVEILSIKRARVILT